MTAADTIPYTTDVRPMIARAEEWFATSPVYDQDTCFRADAGYARTDWGGVLGGCHQPYYRTDCSGFVSMVWACRSATPPRVLVSTTTSPTSPA
jgi:hypothetical protein